MNAIKIRKNGTFYSIYDDDCYILYYLLNYQIKNNKVGFPKSALNKVISILEENKINYVILGGESGEEEANFRNLNKYNKILQLGREKYEKDINYRNLVEKVKKVSPEKLDRILETISNIINE